MTKLQPESILISSTVRACRAMTCIAYGGLQNSVDLSQAQCSPLLTMIDSRTAKDIRTSRFFWYVCFLIFLGYTVRRRQPTGTRRPYRLTKWQIVLRTRSCMNRIRYRPYVLYDPVSCSLHRIAGVVICMHEGTKKETKKKPCSIIMVACCIYIAVKRNSNHGLETVSSDFWANTKTTI